MPVCQIVRDELGSEYAGYHTKSQADQKTKVIYEMMPREYHINMRQVSSQASSQATAHCDSNEQFVTIVLNLIFHLMTCPFFWLGECSLLVFTTGLQ